MKLLFAISLLAAPLWGLSPLFERGYTVIPEPRVVHLSPKEFAFGPRRQLQLGLGVSGNNAAVLALKEGLGARLGSGRGLPAVRLTIQPDSVQLGSAVDLDRAALAAQAYRLDLSDAEISITANASAGLFYGVETLVQLLNSAYLPQGQIIDWPDMRLRQILWDDAHHLERLPELKRAIRQAAFYKINGFALKLEGHFQFRSAPALVEPQALSPAEYQELTDYGLRYHVQVIPYLDAPGHIAFILKHPEYKGLREYPESNYELCLTNPDSNKLLFGMFDNLIEANRGGRYFYLSTDEAYYAGLANNAQCQEEAAAAKLGGPGKLLAEFVTKAAEHLRGKGREVIFWGEYPLKPDDLAGLPRYIINGEVDRAVDSRYKALGIRQMIYTSIEGEEKLFPDYFPPFGRPGRVAEAFQKIATDTSRQDSDLIGAVVAGWADMGLHPETFWLGYATATSAAWNPGADPRELMASFYNLHFGPEALRMDRIFQLLSHQAQFWSDSWDTGPSQARKPIFGNSYAVFTLARPAHDQTLPLPTLPFSDDWERSNARRIQLAAERLAENDELAGLLLENVHRVRRNRYTLEVFIAINGLCRQNLNLIETLAQINGHLGTASKGKDGKAVLGEMDRALDLILQMRLQRNKVLQEATATWEKSWLPRVAEANGRRFLHDVDDVKDHLPDRTVDMSYLVYRELLLPVQPWAGKLLEMRNRYAESHQLALRDYRLDWAQR